jgi:replication initiation and membrane attachment protein
MIEVLRMSITEKGLFDREELRRTARKYYQYNNNGKLPTLVYRTQPEYLKNPEGDKSTKARIIHMFENTTPYDFLKIKNKGVEPSNRDLKIIEGLMIDLDLSPSVVNVLIDYVLRKNNNKLNKEYMETIGIQWRRSNIKTAEEAMEIAKKENNKITKKIEKNTNIKPKENNPAWFNVDIKSEEMSEQEIQELEELLKDYR